VVIILNNDEESTMYELWEVLRSEGKPVHLLPTGCDITIERKFAFIYLYGEAKIFLCTCITTKIWDRLLGQDDNRDEAQFSKHSTKNGTAFFPENFAQ